MIEGDRVLLRIMDAGDTDDVVRMRSAPDVLSQLFSDEPPTREGHLRWLEQVQARGDRHDFMIIDRASCRSVGIIGLSHIDRKHRHAEYGVLIGEVEARGKGLASEASRLLLDYAFRTLGLNRVYLHLFADNEAALRLYRKVGFEQEGVLRQHVLKNGRFRDVIVMAILRDDKHDSIL